MRGGAVAGPYGGAGVATRSSGTVVGPAGGSRSAAAGSGSYTTGRDHDRLRRGRPGRDHARRGLGGARGRRPFK
ncbi:hypothetical protein FTUN_6159 [Frigoriglobus tundricola]|uniref:Uncharacterized protein n=1 Tax=Frigoriglobus tundricola TaxID=2774151 RepID=A0A6M5YYG1_9BACT|nr:hypothetical protein FTUN_6159 [Frigoriglobus tundricola]